MITRRRRSTAPWRSLPPAPSKSAGLSFVRSSVSLEPVSLLASRLGAAGSAGANRSMTTTNSSLCRLTFPASSVTSTLNKCVPGASGPTSPHPYRVDVNEVPAGETSVCTVFPSFNTTVAPASAGNREGNCVGPVGDVVQVGHAAVVHRQQVQGRTLWQRRVDRHVQRVR